MEKAATIPEAYDALCENELALKALLLIGKHEVRRLSQVGEDLAIDNGAADHATKFLLNLGLIRYNPHKIQNPKFRLSDRGCLFLDQLKAVNKQARDYLGDKAQFIITK